MARGSLQISARIPQVASSPSSVLGHRTVRRSSASTMSRRVSNGAVPRSAAMSATLRNAHPSLAGAYVSPMT